MTTEKKSLIDEITAKAKEITLDDVYKFVGQVVIWSFISRTTVRILSK